MAEYKDGHGIRRFEPDNTDTEFYINSNYTTIKLGYILELAKEKWGNDIDIDDLDIAAEYIHTDCLGHDCYDAGDYTRFIRVEYTPSKEENKEEM